MTTPTQRIIAATEASLDALDASLLDLSRAAAAKFGDVCAWCGGPCHCPDFDAEWPGELDVIGDLHQALADAAAACPDCSPPRRAARHPHAPAAGCGRPAGGRLPARHRAAVGPPGARGDHG